MTKEGDKSMDISEAVVKFNVSRRTIYRWIKDGRIKASKQRGQWVIDDNMTDMTTKVASMTNMTDMVKGLSQRVASLERRMDLLVKEGVEKKRVSFWARIKGLFVLV